jgi:excisionase family DNA binding protein
MRAQLDNEDVELIARRVVELLRDELRDQRADDGWMDSKQAAAYLSLTVAALHRVTARREVPFHQDRPGGKCWFKRSELDAWRAA